MKSAVIETRIYQLKTNIIMKTKTSILAVTKAFFILLVMCCFSCTSVKEEKTNEKMNGKPITVIEFDSCEYVGFFDGSGYNYTHKGNCKYCAERSLK